jgi:hypothetical protein
MKKVFASISALLVGASLALAVTVTNQGQVITITTLEDVAAAGTGKDYDQSQLNLTARSGYIVSTYDVAVHGGTVGAHTFGVTVPKGAILLEGACIEVNQAVQPAASTNAIALGGVTLVATGASTINSVGIKDLAAVVPAITTAAGQPTLTISGEVATSGVFTLYLPIMWGNAR